MKKQVPHVIVSKKLDDEELAKLAQSGHDDAEETLIRRYKDLVRGKSHAYYIVGGDLEDVVQEGMIGLVKAINNYDANREAKFQTFAEVCINRQILDAIKRANRKKHTPLNESVSLTYELAKEVINYDSAEYEILLKETFAFVIENKGGTFSKLELDVWKQYMEGRTYKDIGKALNKPLKTVYGAMERTKKKIMDYLMA